ncbi:MULTISPECIES: o-succinylbenzoate synthase [Flavobacterium]|uniref:O-succinylbenzoate synthase n=2 Tax=Flavobacterium covae TaxID=2906076 RepID=A0ABW8PG21_9FLAO|nr:MULTISPECIES: o-succinylbenzoate synthase [Flavobacterium]OXA83105.1 o-succinylbenzoate synthase [Flavobacterium columnare NBRC 100251 = ATCC 23463]AMA48891.1 o-succinylbenzoate synthase [Flavobacterium covae]AND64977.1 o-succinylbenzoate synthase [Flavobacterium covae]MCJ1807190.1 o-succinylbenzoate synthase [Flavobacterium covae]MCJ1810074.1 o-succinylbenzoate synthase [Flavobacterium covae]
MKAIYIKHLLDFKRPAGTSRGILNQKETWFLILEKDNKKGIGECGILRGLSADDRPDYEEKLNWVCQNIHLGKDQLWNELIEFPSIQFGVEMAFKSLESSTPFELFPSKFTKGEDVIPINGLIWMGSETFMQEQIKEKIKQGFRCIKMKIGAIDFEQEYKLLQFIRSNFSKEEIELRVDANGAFDYITVFDKLEKLANLSIHSIEQPIAKGQKNKMKDICSKSKLPIALDEELIGVFSLKDKEKLLLEIKPQYIILKPSFIGGFRGTDEWIELAEKNNIRWWITSALESNIGLNAIAQYTFMKQNPIPQGLGTGSLYLNNIDGPLEVRNGFLSYNPELKWNINL